MRGRVAGGLDREAKPFSQGEKRFRGFLGDEGEVDVFRDEGPLVGATEQEQRLGQADRSRVDRVEAVDELAGVVARILACHLEKRLRDRQRGAQLVGGIRCEPLLLGDERLEPREHGVEGIGELAELVVAAGKPDPVGERSARGSACRVGDPRQRGEHAAGEKPSPYEPEHEEKRQRDRCGRRKGAQEERVVPGHQGTERADHTVGEQGVERSPGPTCDPRGSEHQEAGEHEEAGVAEGELEADARTRCSSHPLLPRRRRPGRCRRGSRRRPPWR